MNAEQIEFRRSAIRPGDCVSDAWNNIGQDYWFYFGISIVAFLIILAAGMIPILSIAILAIVSGPVWAGVNSVFLAKTDGVKKDFGAMFDGFRRFAPTVVIGIILSIPGIMLQVYQTVTTISQLVGLFTGKMTPAEMNTEPFPPLLIGLYIFMILFAWTIGLLLHFSYLLIMDYNLDAIGAMKLSAGAVLGNLGGIIVLAILNGLLGLAGALACGIGIFFVWPVVLLASTNAYRQVFPIQNGNMMNFDPPSPGEYGNMFGQTG